MKHEINCRKGSRSWHCEAYNLLRASFLKLNLYGIQFLTPVLLSDIRRLRDMLIENQEVISFEEGRKYKFLLPKTSKRELLFKSAY